MLDKVFFAAVSVICFGTLAWVIKRMLAGVEIRMTASIKSITKTLAVHDDRYHVCREGLPDRFAPRKETSDEIAKLYQRTDDNRSAIDRLHGRLDSVPLFTERKS